jgi:glyoxylate/succinic semialdehyde reductase
MSLAEKSDLKQDVLLDVLSKGAMACPLFAMKGPSMVRGEFPPAFPLKHQQKDMRLACELGCAQRSAACAATCTRLRWR